MACPLHNLTKKGVTWRWTTTEQNAFEALKEAVTKEPVLLFPKLTKPFEMEVDASAITLSKKESRLKVWPKSCIID